MQRQVRVVLALLACVIAPALPTLTHSLHAEATAITTLPGFPRTEPYGSFFVSPSVVDINGDGKLDVLTADSTGCVWGYDRAGAPLPGFPWKTGGVCDNAPRINSPLAIGDIDGDGKLEVVAGTRGSGPNAGQRGKVFVWNRSGTLLSGWPKEMAWAYITNGNEPEVYSVALANITGDAKLEIIALTSNEAGSNTNYAPNLYAWNINGTTVTGFPTSSHKGSGAWGHIAAADIDKDGYAEILVGRDEIYFYAYKGNGQHLAGWPLHTYLDDAKRTWGKDKFMEYTRSGPAVGDLDGNGSLEVVLAGKVRDPLQNMKQTNSAIMVVGQDGKRRAGWSVAKLAGAPLQTTFTPNNQIALADLDSDGKLEIVVTFDDGTIRAYRENGTQIWSYNYTGGKKLFASEVAIGDVTGDGKVDIVFGTYSFDSTANSAVRLHALNTSGQSQSPFPLTPTQEGTSTSPKGFMAGITLADLDSDGSVEIVAHSRGGVLYVWDSGAPYRADRMPWPTARQNNLRNGLAPRGGTTPAGPTISKLTLINADTDQPVAGFDSFQSGATVNTATIGTSRFSVQAFTSPAAVGSVEFVLDGATRTENAAPYALNGDNGGDFLPWTATVGSHTLRVTAYSGSNRTGTAGPATTVNFTVSNTVSAGPTISKLTLINADTDQPILGFDPLQNWAAFSLSALGTSRLSVLATTSPATIGSVEFILDGASYRTENGLPYALGGNNGSDYVPWNATVGTHTLKVIPYSGSNRTGTAGPATTITFTVR
ncbi:MAG: VCBS repeat-containing protein [Herpetosiphonaceae bacterium]|nr:VCBS repeat-containing protein [Herpetosiphonaceae bacterium]